MIKINLLPQKRRAQKTAEGSQLWAVAVVLLVALEAVGFFVYHGNKKEELTAQRRKNAELEEQISQAKNSVKAHADVKAQLERLRAREDAISKLQSARTGPTAVLLELARMMTPGRGPSVDPERLNQLRRENPLAVYNPGWDARRLWLAKYVENLRQVRLEGLARDGEDVSELARRMALSSYFTDVRLLPAKKTHSSESGLDLVQFQLEAKARY
ncbi:MAG TPA: PilN domain-containing protein [Polyangiaceae bacterium]|nr:PilN domain-containing protein [Polyangiaceae bacterium]